MNQLEKALETEKESSAKDDVNADVQNKLELLGILNKMQASGSAAQKPSPPKASPAKDSSKETSEASSESEKPVVTVEDASVENKTANADVGGSIADEKADVSSGLLSVLKLADNKYKETKNKKKEGGDDMSPYALIGYASSSKRTNKGETGTVSATPVSTKKLQEKKSKGLVETDDTADGEDIVSKKSKVKL